MLPKFTFRLFKVITLAIVVLISTNLYATDKVKDENKNGTQKNQKKEQTDQVQPATDVQPASTSTTETEKKNEEGVSISSVSFNFIFYLIYKIKYADLFKLPARKKEDASANWSGVNLNRLYEKLTRPNI